MGKFLFNLASGIRNESQLAGAFDGLGEATLMERAEAGAGLLVDPGVSIQKLLQVFRILVVNLAQIISAKMALFHKFKMGYRQG